MLLLTNIYLMLAQERRTELGTLRAIGYSRKKCPGRFSMRVFLFYFLVCIGVLAGLGIARFILGSFVNLFEDVSPLIPFLKVQICF